MIVSVLEENDAAAVGDRLYTTSLKASRMKNLNSKKKGNRGKKNKSSSYSMHAGGGDRKVSYYDHQAPRSVMGNPTVNTQQIGHHVPPSVRSPSKTVVKKRLSVSTKDHSQTKTRMKIMESSHERFHSNTRRKYSRLGDIHQRYKKHTQNRMKHIGKKNKDFIKGFLIRRRPLLNMLQALFLRQ